MCIISSKKEIKASNETGSKAEVSVWVGLFFDEAVSSSDVAQEAERLTV